MDRDPAYFSRRASEERSAASHAQHPGARKAHLDLAERYDALSSAELASVVPAPDPASAAP